MKRSVHSPLTSLPRVCETRVPRCIWEDMGACMARCTLRNGL